jgi:sulfur-oxidizing protein SoxA
MRNLTRGLALALLVAASAMADPTGAVRQSSYALMSPENRAMQDDPSQNPATFWVLDGETLWQTPSGKRQVACARCHGDDASSMKGVAASFPKFVGDTLLNLSDQVNECRQTRQEGEPYEHESKPLLALTSYIGLQSRGLPITVEKTDANAVALEAGKTLFYERLGQLNLSCAQCHAERSGQKLGGNPIPQGHPTAYPLYRLEWQSVGSLQRRLRNCMTGVRAEPFALGSKELVELELFLTWRARGMLMETPGVRP